MDGLSQVGVAALRARFGANELQRDRRVPRWRVLVREVRSPLIALIVGAAVAAVVVGSLLAQVVVLYVPSVCAVIAGRVLTPADGALALGLGLIPVTVLELVKLVGLGTWLAEREV